MACASCGLSPANLRCTQCKGVYYCSRDCQKANWKSHKAACSLGQSLASPSAAAAADRLPSAALLPPTMPNQVSAKDTIVQRQQAN